MIDQLWACASDHLARVCQDFGVSDICTEDKLLASLKKHAIKDQNLHVNRYNFLRMCQNTEEPVTNYSSRLTGQANTCDYKVKCTGCETAR